MAPLYNQYNLMSTYAYLMLCILMFFPWIIIYLTRKDLRRRMIKAGLFALPFGWVSEIWYFEDYWQPPTTAGVGQLSIEDALSAFFIVGISITLFDALFTSKNIKNQQKRVPSFIFLLILGLTLMGIFSSWLKFNSIFVTGFACYFVTAIILTLRPDLLFPAFLSGILNSLLFIIIYLVLFNLIFPNFWESYWLLKDTKYNITILGKIPLTEVLWYNSWGTLAGCLYDYAGGYSKELKKKFIF